MHSIIENLAYVIWRILGCVIPKHADYIVLSTYPDFDDTFRALQQALEARNRKLIVLTRRVHVPPLGACDQRTIVAAANSFRGIWYYHRSKTILFTHGLFSRWSPNRLQLVINLWHGTPIKNIGLLDKKGPQDIPKSDYVLAESSAYKAVMANAFGIDPRRVLLASHPRTDMLYSQKVAAVRQANPEKTIVAWLPTYRKSITGDVREDGSPDKDVLSGYFDTERLDQILEEYNAICVVKPHPMAVFSRDVFSNSTRIVLLEDADLAAENLSVYEFLSNADLLITDLSSVYFDFHLTGKPSLLFFPDRADYEASRGFVRPLEDVLHRGFVEGFEEFIEELACTLGQMDNEDQMQADLRTFSERAKFSLKFLDMVEILQKSDRKTRTLDEN